MRKKNKATVGAVPRTNKSTHTFLDLKAGGPNELYPLEDESKVEERRRETGLEPLKDYLIRTDIKNMPAQEEKK